ATRTSGPGCAGTAWAPSSPSAATRSPNARTGAHRRAPARTGAHRRGRTPAFDRAAYRRRRVIECCVGWLTEARRVATRDEKLATPYLGVLTLGMIRKHLRLLLPPLSHEP
ncbi:MAG TPA: hypothetical protein VGD56_17795, partial [Gemmatirosa sp.]